MPEGVRSAQKLFDPRRLELARKVKSLRKKELAQLVDVSPAAISQYESGRAKPSAAVLARIALALGFPIEFFSGGRPGSSLDPSLAHFRSLRSTTQIDRDSALAQAELTWELVEALGRHIRLPAVQLPELHLDEILSASHIERVASEVRAAWSLSSGPIPNVVRLLESHGVVVTRLMAGLAGVDAFSRWFGDRPVVVLCADKGDAARSRFDASHELGHLILHHDVEPAEAKVEKEAHIFAGAFLLPESEIKAELPSRLDWQRLSQLKRTWGVSIAALLYRARTLGVMGDATYRRAMSTMSKNGWRREEPVDLGPAEAPSLFERAMSLLEQRDIGLEDLANDLCLPVERVREIVSVGDERPSLDLS